MSAYSDAVTAINAIAAGPHPTARQDLAALKALIELQMEKLPPDKPDYETENVLCDDCMMGGRSTCYHKENTNANT